MIAKAPAVAKLFGEHPSTIYMPKEKPEGRNSLAILAALDIYASSEVKRITAESNFVLKLPDLKVTYSVNPEILDLLYECYSNRTGVESCLRGDLFAIHVTLPHLVVVARLAHEFGVNIEGLEATITSKIPRESGLASSSATATALAVSLLQQSGIKDDNVVIEVARDADRVVHRTESGGIIDVPTSYYGGCISYSNKGGVKTEIFPPEIGIVIINTGPKKSTGAMVAHVKDLYKKKTEFVERILFEKENCAKEGLIALHRKDPKRLGELMSLNHDLLKELGVSTDRLDYGVALAKRAGAYGAKLSGGGGGGTIVALAENPQALSKFMTDNNFPSFPAKVSKQGASAYMPDRLSSTD